MAPFYGWGSTASRLESLRGGSLLFTTKLIEIPGTDFTDLGRMKGCFDLGATQWFWTRDPWIRNPAPWPLHHCSITLVAFVDNFEDISLLVLVQLLFTLNKSIVDFASIFKIALKFHVSSIDIEVIRTVFFYEEILSI